MPYYFTRGLRRNDDRIKRKCETLMGRSFCQVPGAMIRGKLARKGTFELDWQGVLQSRGCCQGQKIPRGLQ